MTHDLILASTSRFRAAMLTNAGVRFRSVPPETDEDAIKRRLAGSPPGRVAQVLAGAKADAVATRWPQSPVIGCDQVLSFEDAIFDKPRDVAEAREHLRRLRGRRHTLLSAVSVVRDGRAAWSFLGEAHLTMRPFSDGFLDRYLEAMGADVRHSVGAYQLEGLGAQLFSQIEGDYFTILGLPLLPLLAYLRDAQLLET